MTYFIQTFGCQMNVHDSEKIAGVLESLGYVKGDNRETASVIVFNTCAIRDTAEQKILGQIGSLKKLKTKDNIICVGGCMTAQKDRPEFLKKRFPFIDVFFAPQKFRAEFEKFIAEQKMKGLSYGNLSPVKKSSLLNAVRDSATNAYVAIAEGCDNFCSYCIVPYVRGRENSRPLDDILKEVKGLIKKGIPQVTLLGQNVNSYRSGHFNFPALLKEIDKIPGKFRIRFMSSHPKDLSDELIEVIATSTHVCHGIHLPVQSGSDAILKAMNRKYTKKDYLNIIKKIKSRIPDAEFSTDLIVGFPGETEKDFEDTLSLIKEIGFQQVFSFIYSRRKGTAADLMENQIGTETKKQRISRLLEVQNKIASFLAKEHVGKVEEILVEGTNQKTNEYVGTTDTGKVVSFESVELDLIGKFVCVKIVKAVKSKLVGELI